MRAVTIEYNSDPRALGPHATHLDLDRWARNLKLAAEERFGVRGILLKQSQAKPLDSSDPDVAAWLISTTAGEGWLAYLEADDGPVTERMLHLAGKTIAETWFGDDEAVFTFDDGSTLRIYARVSGGCCCCGDGYLSYEDDAPMYGPEPPPPPPRAVAFWREGEHAVTIRSIVQVPLLAGLGWRVVFTLDGGSGLQHYFAPLNRRPPDEFIATLPVSARLSVKPKTTWDRFEDINAGREPDKQSYTFTFDIQET